MNLCLLSRLCSAEILQSSAPSLLQVAFQAASVDRDRFGLSVGFGLVLRVEFIVCGFRC